jgi:hypothetical protein
VPMSVRRPLGLTWWCAGIGVRGNVSEHPVVVSSRHCVTLRQVGRPGGAVLLLVEPLVRTIGLQLCGVSGVSQPPKGRRVASRRFGGGGPGVPGVC